jgi:periplasmic divalent cation tolerance protein
MDVSRTDGDSVLVGLCTCPESAASTLAAHLVDRQVAACVNIIPTIESVYRWLGKVEAARESLLVIKTVASRAADLRAAILERHPYELPELLLVPVASGHPAYLDWVARETRGTASRGTA